MSEQYRAELEEQAALWLVQQEDPEFRQQQEFQDWLAKSELHQQVYQELAGTWTDLSQLAISDVKPVVSVTPIGKTKPRLFWAMAASIFVVALIWQLLPVAAIAPIELASAKGQVVTHQLSDGSSLTLNGDSKVRVSFSHEHRRIEILHGDAHFSVASDKMRPFTVSYSGQQVTALGTQFTLTTRPELELLVTEHSVRLDGEGGQFVVQQGKGMVKRGQWLKIPESNLPDAAAWRRDELVFNRTPLNQVLNTIQARVSAPIRLVQLTLLNEPVSGRFSLKEPEKALGMIATGLSLELEKFNGEWLLH